MRPPLPLFRSFLLAIPVAALACNGDNLVGPSGGTLEVIATTSGVHPDPDGYTVQVDTGPLESTGPSSSYSRSNLPPGTHTIHLADVAANCVVEERNPQTISIVAGQKITASFTIICFGPGSVYVQAMTSGFPDRDGYRVSIDGTDLGPLATHGGVSIPDFAPGKHSVRLSGVADNCVVTGTNPRNVEVVIGEALIVVFAVDCTGRPAALRVTASFAGWDALLPYCCFFVADGDRSGQWIRSAEDTVLAMVSGVHSVQLNGVPPDCLVAEGTAQTVTLTAGDTAQVRFTIRCVLTIGSVKVTVSTSGTPPDPDGYFLQVTNKIPIPVDTSVTFNDISLGTYEVALSGVNTNCTVTGGTTQIATVVARDTTDVSFVVICSPEGLARWTPMSVDFNKGFLRHLSGTSGRDVFAVGFGDSKPCGECGMPSSILHYDGTGWSTQLRIEKFSFLYGVWALSPSEAYSVGSVYFDNASGSGVVYRYDGLSWTEMTRFSNISLDGTGYDDAYLYSVWASPSSEVFAVGGLQREYSSLGFIGYYDGAAWHRFEVPGVNLFAVWGSSGRNVYAGGIKGDYSTGRGTGILLHFDGNQWSTVLELPKSIGSIWGSSAQDIYVIQGDQPVFHFDGSAWSSVFTPTEGLTGIWGSSAKDVYAVGYGGSIVHFDGSAWAKQTGGPDTHLYGVWGSSANEVFAVGEDGTILHHTP